MASEKDEKMKFGYLSERWKDEKMKFWYFQKDEKMKRWNLVTFQKDEKMKRWNSRIFQKEKRWKDEIWATKKDETGLAQTPVRFREKPLVYHKG